MIWKKLGWLREEGVDVGVWVLAVDGWEAVSELMLNADEEDINARTNQSMDAKVKKLEKVIFKSLIFH